jgi:PAS domain S-box-containing protein
VQDYRFRRLFEGIPLGMGIFNAEHRFVEVNRALAVMLGYSKDELVGRTIQDITHPDDRGWTQAFLESMELSAATERRMEKRYLRKDGETVYGKVTALSIRDEDGEIMFAVGIIENITEQKKVEAALRKAQEAEAARLVEQGRLEGVLLTVRETAHQIGNALNQAQGFTELTLLRNDLSPKTREMLDLAMEGLESVTTYLHRLQRVVRVATKATPTGPSLDVERSVGN